MCALWHKKLTTLIKLMRPYPWDQLALDLLLQLFGSALIALVPPIPRSALAYTLTASNINNASTWKYFHKSKRNPVCSFCSMHSECNNIVISLYQYCNGIRSEDFHVQIHSLLNELEVFHYTRHHWARRINQFYCRDVGTPELQVTVAYGVRVLEIMMYNSQT